MNFCTFVPLYICILLAPSIDSTIKSRQQIQLVQPLRRPTFAAAPPSLLREAPTLARTWQRTSLRARLTRSNIGHERNTFLNLGEIDFRKIIWKFKKLATCLNMSGHYNFLLVQHIFLEIKTEEVVCTPIVMYQLRS